MVLDEVLKKSEMSFEVAFRQPLGFFDDYNHPIYKMKRKNAKFKIVDSGGTVIKFLLPSFGA